MEKFQYSAGTTCWDHVSGWGWDLCSPLTFLFPPVDAEGDLESSCPQGQSLQAALQLSQQQVNKGINLHHQVCGRGLLFNHCKM